MKHCLHLFSSIAIFTFGATSLVAETFEVDGISYEITSRNDLTVEVAPSSYDFTGQSVQIPASVTNSGVNYRVAGIGDNAFAECDGVREISIPDGVTRIGQKAFYNCNALQRVNIPEGVDSIGQEAFMYCFMLDEIMVPSSVTSIGYWAFFNCGFNMDNVSVDSENGVYDSRNDCNAIIETATNTLIFGCRSSVIPDDVVRIEDFAFSGAMMKSLTIPANVVSIGMSVFVNGYLERISVNIENPVYDSRNECNAIIETSTNTLVVGCDSTVIPESISNIGDGAFLGCDMANVSIPLGVTSIGRYAFGSCHKLTRVSIAESVTRIDTSAFYDCRQLEEITIPANVSFIGNDAFGRCAKLTAICCEAVNPPVCDDNVFSTETLQKSTLYVPAERLEAYRSADVWKEFQSIKANTDYTSLPSISSLDKSPSFYSLQGAKLATPQRGKIMINAGKRLYFK